MPLLLPHVTPEMLFPAYWLARIDAPDDPLLTPAAVAAFNASVPAGIGIPAVLDLPDELPGATVRAAIQARPTRDYFTADGTPYTAADWDALQSVMALDAIPATVTPRFGLCVRRTPVRTFPTDRVALEAPDDLPFDQFSETTIDIGWPVAVLHPVAGGEWGFCLTPGYWGWLHLADIALADRATVEGFVNAEPFAVASAPWAELALLDGGPHVTAQMGTRLPVAGPNQLRVPRSTPGGRLSFAAGHMIDIDPGWRIGYTTPTPTNLLTQAFKLLGESYCWGGTRLGRPGRDCSRMVRDTWTTTGVLLPRNGNQQGIVGQRLATFTPEDDPATKAAALAGMPPGALLLMPGHIMLHLGVVDGRPYAIHDMWRYRRPDGGMTMAAQVVVSDLPLEPSAPNHTLLERLTHVQLPG